MTLSATRTHGEREDRPRIAEVETPGFTLLWHPDPRRIGERAVLAGLDTDRTVELSRTSPRFAHPGSTPKRPLDDPFISRRPIVLRPGSEADTIEVIPTHSGSDLWLDGEIVTASVTLDAEALERGVVLMIAHRVVALLHRLDPLAPAATAADGLVGQSAALAAVRRDIRAVADVDVPVLLRGESGVGKELVAAALHGAGGRSQGPFVAVNMAAIPASLAASELFGSARGAFTGARAGRRGHFGRADGGTLFLDEIGDTPAEVQPLLLRALETGELQTVGADGSSRVEVRLVTATDAALETEVAAGRFRAPLLHRLRGFEILIPPLRQRRDDFGVLFRYFLEQALASIDARRTLAPAVDQARPWMPAPLVARLAVYDWPGNIRELRNIVQQVAISSRDRERAELPPPVLAQLERGPAIDPEVDRRRDCSAPSARLPGEITDRELEDALRRHRWRPQAAARHLGISRAAVYTLIERHPSLRKGSELGADEIEACARRHRDDLARMAEDLRVSETALKRRMRQLGLR
ncbi:MAG: sigma 54-interacting transcriptional regulator [Acidobacteriota bacterium]